MAELPSGIVTFLVSDVEGSTRLLDRYPEAAGKALARHAALIRQAIEAHAGVVFSAAGDGFSAAFATAIDGLAAALEAQRTQQREPSVETGPLRVRMALHTAAAEPSGGDYYGSAVNRTHRLAAIARGGQVLLSQATQELVSGSLLSGTTLRDLGVYRLRDLDQPERVFQLVAPDLPDDSAWDRVLTTILFTDIVSSTATAVELGDRRWRALLASHHDLVREHLLRFRGREVRTTGDGVCAAFDTPTRAIECARALGESLRRLGIEIRAGVHTGECELVGDALEGVAVHAAARVADVAEGGEVLVSSTVKDLVAGSAIAFVERGTHVFKGLPGEWRLFSISGTTGSHVQSGRA